MDKMFSIIVFCFLFFALIIFIGYFYFYALKQSSQIGASRYRKLLEVSKQYKLPRSARRNIHKPYDYWDDAGDGSGVNYVQMEDGSVRID